MHTCSARTINRPDVLKRPCGLPELATFALSLLLAVRVKFMLVLEEFCLARPAPWKRTSAEAWHGPFSLLCRTIMVPSLLAPRWANGRSLGGEDLQVSLRSADYVLSRSNSWQQSRLSTTKLQFDLFPPRSDHILGTFLGQVTGRP